MSARIDLNHKIHVLTKKEELDSVRIPGKLVVVLDILFATTTMVTALAHGATEIVPVLDEAAARAFGNDLPEDSFVLAGELYAETLQGFAHPAPLSLLEHGIEGKTVVYSTTNGTVAMTQAAGAARVYCGALLNARAIVERIVSQHARETVLIVCSGSVGNFNLEDFYGAGYLVSLFARSGGRHELSDAALAAQLLHDRGDAYECLAQGRVGRMMLERGLERELRFAAQKSRFDVVPRLAGGRLRAA
jgi:2-phosphosulfolactate phosphatase